MSLLACQVTGEGVLFGGLYVNPFTGAAVFNLFGYHHVNKKARHMFF